MIRRLSNTTLRITKRGKLRSGGPEAAPEGSPSASPVQLPQGLAPVQGELVRDLPIDLFRPDDVFRFESESEQLSQVDCKWFLKPLRWGRDDRQLFQSRADIGAPTVKALLSGGGTSQSAEFPWIQVLSNARCVLESLHHVHAKRCVHRQVRASTVLIDGERAYLDCPPLVAYQSAQIADQQSLLEFAEFASPELAGSIDHDVGAASDLYSVGVLMYTLLRGHPPFQGESVGAILFQHVAADPVWDKFDSQVPPVVIDIISRLLRKEPRDRYQSAKGAIADLDLVLAAAQQGLAVERFAIGRQDQRHSLVEPAFVGRQNELAAVIESLDRVAAGPSDRIAITCPSGIGKSRFVLEVIRAATRQGFHVFRSIASDDAGQQPTAPLLRIIEQLIARAENDSLLRDHLSHELADIQGDVATLFPALADVLNWTGHASHDVEELGLARIKTAFARTLAGLGQPGSPVLVWIDDCQWLDAQSLSIIERLGELASAHALFLFSMRDHEGVTANFLQRVECSQRVQLKALSDDEVRSLIGSMAGHLPEEVVESIVRLAAGSPFMASAVMYGLVESAVLTASPQGWQIDQEKLAGVQASASAAELLLQRLEQLPDLVRQLLTSAAVIGKEFQEGMVAELSGISHIESRLCLERARQQRLVWSMPNGHFAFVHDKIREALIGRLEEGERRAFHRRYAEYLQQQGTEHAFELAHHFHEAGAPQESLPHALRAAESAQKMHSLDRAEELLRIALNGEQYADHETRRLIHTGLADVLMLAGKYDESERWFENSLALADSPLELAKIHLKRGELAFKRGNKEAAVELFHDALKELNQFVPRNTLSLGWKLTRELLAQTLHSLLPGFFVASKGNQPSEEQRLTWRIFSRLAHGYWYTKGKFHTLWAHLRGMNLAERYEPTHELAQAYSEHAPALSLVPWHSRGIQYVQKSLKIRQQLNDIWGQGQSRNFHSILLYSSSQFEKCVEQAMQAEAILVRTGDFWEVNIARYQLAASLYRQGKLKEAWEVARRTYDAALSIGDYQSTGNIIDVWVRATYGEIPEEIIEAEKHRTLRDRQGECQVLLAEGITCYFKEEYGQAAQCFEKAIQIAESAGVVNAFITPNYAWRTTALREAFESNPPKTRRGRKQALNRIVRAAKKAVKVGRWFQNDLPHAWREYGAACGLCGWPRRALSALVASMEVAERQGAAFELAQTQEVYGQFGLEYGWPDAELLANAGRQKSQEILQAVRHGEKTDSISLIDRFDTLLSAGRQIISANSRSAIFANSLEAAKRLLRGQRTLIVVHSGGAGQSCWQVHGRGDEPFDPKLVEQAASTGKTVVTETESVRISDQRVAHQGSFLCSPITLRGQVTACLYVAHESLANLWGSDEIRIADYLATSAGGALEKADTFHQLEQLNIQLEEKVKERTVAVEARSQQLEVTARELLATQTKLEQARDEAESANAAKSQFLARMSHEIRTPISAVIGFTEVLLRGMVRDPKECRRRLQTIHANGAHLLQLINDLLDLSKIEANKMEVEAIDCCPLRILHDVVTSLQVRAEEKGIGLKMQFDGLVPKRIVSDPTRLRQILTNVIGNAIKFTSQGYVAVTLRVCGDECLETSEAPSSQQGQLEFEITDTGIGMTSEQMDRIFDPFTQADTSVTRKFGGTGLGLSISRQLAEALGGGVRVSSEPGAGSTFYVRIATGALYSDDFMDSQAANQFLSEEITASQVRADLSAVHVLIVDDTDTNRELLSLILREAGAEVALAENGQQAVEWLQRNSAHVVLMDMQMPVMDGYAATAELRQRGFDKPIIALTAHSMLGDEVKCKEAGCNDYLSKPIDINLLLRKLAAWSHGDTACIDESAAVPSVVVAVPHDEKTACDEDRNTWECELPDEEPFREFAIEFVGKVKERMAEIQGAIERNDYEVIAKSAHWIKGTGGTVGLHHLSQLGRKLELATHDRDRQQIEASVLDLKCYLGLGKEHCSATDL